MLEIAKELFVKFLAIHSKSLAKRQIESLMRILKKNS